MLTLGYPVRRHGGATTRRQFLQAGALGPLGLSLPGLLQASVARGAGAAATFGRAKRCILVFLNGGPSQLDTWDMKPGAPAEIRGELAPIATSVPGLQVGELLPLSARHADKYKVVRSVTHADAEHTTGMCTMLTGTFHPRPNVAQTAASPEDHPHLGAIYAKWQGWRGQLPPFVALPTLFQPPGNGIWPGQDGGFLGKRYDPFVIRGDKRTAEFAAAAIATPDEVTLDRLATRRALREGLMGNTLPRGPRGRLAEMDDFYAQAFSLMGSQRLLAALDLSREPQGVHELYGRHLLGQGLLLARRLIEASVPLVTVYWIDPTPPGLGGGEFDSHGQIYRHMRQRLFPPTDQALAALYGDLAARGLLEDTLVVCMAEFGRTPRINAQAGRDHWPQAQSILLAGAGITGGTIYGATDASAAYPVSDPVTPPDLAQTILHLLGVPPELELSDPLGRPLPACRGTAVPGLMA